MELSAPEETEKFQSTLPLRGATMPGPVQTDIGPFQSTLPLRGATRWPPWHRSFWRWNFNPRSPCGERRPLSWWSRAIRSNFNPRSPCGERQYQLFAILSFHKFQSTLPLRGATTCSRLTGRREENFNPRSPCGERLPNTGTLCHCNGIFQSTLPLRGATAIQPY